MPEFKCLNGDMHHIDGDDFDAFETKFRGALIGRDHDDYDEARSIWNALIDKRPAMIAKCAGLSDVVAAVNFARQHNLLISVRGGGHNVSGSALCDDGLTIDLSQMRAARVDRKSMTVHVQGGAKLSDIDYETQMFGLATTTGNVSETGIGGLTLGGGFGNLRRKYGLGVDNLVSVEIVTADGKVLRAAADENPDLYWAVRGGGGNFGIVTSFEFRLYKFGPEVFFAAQFFPVDDAPELMRKWRDFVETAPDEISSLSFFWTIPRVDGFPPELQGQRVFLYAALHSGTAEEGEKALAPLMNIGNPILDLSGVAPYVERQAAFDPFMAKGGVYPKIYSYWKSLYLNGLTDDFIDQLVETSLTMPSEQILMAVWHLGGAMARVAEEDTAFGKRQAPYLLSYDCSWLDPALSDAVIAWTRTQIKAAESESPGGLYLNFPGVGENTDELVKAAYGENFARLRKIKQKYDPENFFRINQNIKP